jgi:hypothetical protein
MVIVTAVASCRSRSQRDAPGLESRKPRKHARIPTPVSAVRPTGPGSDSTTKSVDCIEAGPTLIPESTIRARTKGRSPGRKGGLCFFQRDFHGGIIDCGWLLPYTWGGWGCCSVFPPQISDTLRKAFSGVEEISQG